MLEPFNSQPHKMVKNTQTISRQQPTNSLIVFDHFVGFALKGFKVKFATDSDFSLKENTY